MARQRSTKRFSEVKKFWESLTDQAELRAACGADLPPFPRHSPFLCTRERRPPATAWLATLYESDASV